MWEHCLCCLSRIQLTCSQAALSPILGLACALIAWLVTAKKNCGNLGVSCTGSNDPMLAGNVVALLSPLVFVPIFTLVFGLDHYDWASMKAIRQGDDHELANAADLDVEDIPGGHVETSAEYEEEQRKLLRAGKISKTMTVVMTLALLVLWPMRKFPEVYLLQACLLRHHGLPRDCSNVRHGIHFQQEVLYW